MTERELDLKMAELDRQLNDPETRMDPHKVWALLAEISRQHLPAGPTGGLKTTHSPRAA
ncbi:peptide chain release factor 1 [Falsiroseomonas tokyonensis]|uniref:Peptide chain release factor 1 n=1 Tax=Falsiroseomonas tokyonensis TaxID=430521 RepID=A0ABV7BY11_9PROT|nr:peptide chain release factor 1 [Falsiroseomonas tokyonensis]MBU8540419.1 peptide chain release factor 1 [Falsiroseomonas tokyonensis]